MREEHKEEEREKNRDAERGDRYRGKIAREKAKVRVVEIK